jgi:hypothetical protein
VTTSFAPIIKATDKQRETLVKLLTEMVDLSMQIATINGDDRTLAGIQLQRADILDTTNLTERDAVWRIGTMRGKILPWLRSELNNL